MSAGELMLYVSCAGSREIVRFAVDRASGALQLRGRTLLPGPPLDTAPAPASGNVIVASYSVPLAVSPDGAFLHAVLRTPPFAVVSYRIDRINGALTPLGEADVPESTPYIHTDRTGRFLLGAAYQGNCLWVSALGPDGAAAPPHQIVAGIDAPHCILPHPDNRSVYVAVAGGDEMLQFRFDAAAGRLSPLDMPIRVADGTRPRHLAFHPRGNVLYCLTEAEGLVDAYRIDVQNGKLSPAGERGSRLPPDPNGAHTIAADLHPTPDGRFLYASERTQGTIAAFAVAPVTGALRFVGSFPTDRVPRSFAVEPAGRFLAAAGQETGRVVIHAIDPANGRLGTGRAYDAGPVPGWVEFVDLAK